MAATPYRHASFNDGLLNVDKLQQLSNNGDWLFDHNTVVRYDYLRSVTRDTGIKIIAGKSGYAQTGMDWIDVPVYFGNFFNAACKPIVTATVETANRIDVKINGHDGAEIDYRGFRGHVWIDVIQGWPSVPVPSGWLHWIAVGF